MLSAAFYAIEMANASDAAPALFQAGMYHGFTGKDLRDEWTACFKPDPELTAIIQQSIDAIKDKDYKGAVAIVEGAEQTILTDANDCLFDPKYAAVKQAYSDQAAVLKKAHSDPNWQ